MRVDPEGVYLRLEPGATLINSKTGSTRSVPVVEMHWKAATNKWQRRSFVATEEAPTLGAVLRRMGEWLDEQEHLQAALDYLEGKK